MFLAWARVVSRHPRAILVVSALLLAGAMVALVHGGTLSTGTIAGIESDRALQLLASELNQPGSTSFTVILASRTHTVADPEFRAAMDHALEGVASDPNVASLRTPFDLPPPLDATLESRDGHAALAIVSVRGSVREAAAAYAEVRARIHPGELSALFTGPLAFKADLDRTLEYDLRRAEIVSMPLALIVLLWVFGSLVAAAVPLVVGGLAVVGGVACVFLLSRVTDVAQYALNIVSLIGLGVAIDYSLFIVSRFRDALHAGRGVHEAVSIALDTAGRAVAFSGVAVAIGLGGLLFYPRSYLASIGLAGAVVVMLAVVAALTSLPALLTLVGRGIDRGKIPFRPDEAEGFWRSLANGVMRRPLLVLIPTLGFMLLAGSPFLKVEIASVDVSILPHDTEARRGDEVLRRDFPDQNLTRIAVVVDFPGTSPVITPDRIGALYDLSRRMAALPGVARVESVVDLGRPMSREDYRTFLSLPSSFLPAPLRIALHESIGQHIAVLGVLTPDGPSSARALAIVRAIRAQRRVGDGTLMVTGQTAVDLDTSDFIEAHTPRAIGFVMAMTAIVLFLLLGSVLLPLKAVVLNLLSITGSFGALVWIFQEGHLRSFFGFEPHPIEPSLPVILFCTVFGLSMDYEVLLLTRMNEEYLRLGDNTRAVAEGLERSGRLITSAAAIMVVVFGAFALAKVILIQAVGLGMAVAVTLDATIVRVLMVPATMRLFGEWNWWAPPPLVWIYDKFGAGRRHTRVPQGPSA